MDIEWGVWRPVSVFSSLLEDARNKQVLYIILHQAGIIFPEIFSLLLETEGSEHQMFNSSAEKHKGFVQTWFRGIISQW